MSDVPLLEACGLRKVYADTVAVDDVSLSVSASRPSFTALAGESGSGKTTIARLLLGLVEPTQGEILYRGQSLSTLDRGTRSRYRREIQAIFQDPYEVYNPFYRVDHILEMPLKRFGLAAHRREREEMIEAALEAVGLRPSETLGRYPHQLSGGQRQRITIARALLLKPRLIIADEPVSMVDASLRATILESLYGLHRDHGISFIYITHDLTTAYQVSDQLVILYGGSVAEAGPVQQIIEAPQHPYTQELIGSIPVPTPGTEWLHERVAEREEEEGMIAAEHAQSDGCRYVNRCPHAMERCSSKRPALFRARPDSSVSCYLYMEAPVVEEVDLPALWAKTEEEEAVTT